MFFLVIVLTVETLWEFSPYCEQKFPWELALVN